MLAANSGRVRLHFAAFAIFSLLIFGCTQMNTEPASAPATKATMPDGTSISLELATTPEQIATGLAGRGSLCESCGMLFIFPEPAQRTFWMRGMRFPLDIIFLDSDYTVLNMAENLQPCESGNSCAVYASNGSSPYVLEVNAGFARKHNIAGGSSMAIAG